MYWFNKNSRTLFVFAAVALCSVTSFAQKVFYEANGLVIMEAENTASPLGKWVPVTTPPGYTGKGALEFMGGNVGGTGGVGTPLQYKFKITTAGSYTLRLRVYKRLEGESADHCNDLYVKLDHGLIPNDTKVFCHGLCGTTWAWNFSGAKSVHNLLAGETYTLTLSGRSQRHNVDRIAFYMSDSTKAQDPATPESSTSGSVGTIKTGHGRYLVPAMGKTAEVYSLTGQYFGRFPIGTAGNIVEDGKLGNGIYITILPGTISQRKLITKP